MKKLLLLILPIAILTACESSGGGLPPGGGGFGPQQGSASRTNPASGGGKSAASPQNKITRAQAVSIANAINQYLETNPVKKAHVETRDETDGHVISFVEFDDDRLAACDWSEDDGSDGTYMYVENSIGYYYFEQDDYNTNSLKKYYVKYRIESSDYDFENSYADYPSRFSLLTSLARSLANSTLELGDDYSEGSGIEVNYYSSGPGNLKIETSLMGLYSSVTEYRDYKPYHLETLGSYDFIYNFDKVAQPQVKSSYELYGDYTQY